MPSHIYKDGAVLCSRYAYMPNKLQYCGGDDNANLFAYAAAGKSDGGLVEILREFATLYPYLKLIAEANKIKDIFDWRVTEAYWLGNNLLRAVSAKNLYDHLIDVQQLRKKLPPALLQKVIGVIPQGALPHHNFHVISIPKRTGHYPVEHTIETMDACKISWGQVKQVKNERVLAEYYPLVYEKNQLVLGKKKARWFLWMREEKSFAGSVRIGDWVSMHWGWVCEQLTENQRKNLCYYTQWSINLANSFVR